MSNNCLKAKSFILFLLMKSNRQKQRFCHPKMADLKAWSHGVRKANSCRVFHAVRPGLKDAVKCILRIGSAHRKGGGEL